MKKHSRKQREVDHVSTTCGEPHWDEGEGDNNTVSTIFAGPAARHAHQSSQAYSHYALLHTMESLWGLAPLTNNDKNAPTMADMLK